MKSQERSARDFVPNRKVGAKDPLSAADDLFRGSLNISGNYSILRSYCSITTLKQGISILHCFNKITLSLFNTTIARYSAYPQRQKHSPAWGFKEVFDSAKIK